MAIKIFYLIAKLLFRAATYGTPGDLHPVKTRHLSGATRSKDINDPVFIRQIKAYCHLFSYCICTWTDKITTRNEMSLHRCAPFLFHTNNFSIYPDTIQRTMRFSRSLHQGKYIMSIEKLTQEFQITLNQNNRKYSCPS